MKLYDKTEAIETLEAILINYDKHSLARELAALSIVYCDKTSNGWKFKHIEDIVVAKDNNKFIVKIGSE